MLRPLFARIREIAVRAAGFLKRVAPLPRCLFLTGCELEIYDRGGGLAASGAYVGEGLSLPYFRRLYGSPASRTRLIPLWALPRFIRSARKRSDIVLVELNALLAALFRGACAISEAWIRQVTRLDGDCYLHRVRGIHSAAEPQPNRCGGIKNPRARKRIYGLVVQRLGATSPTARVRIPDHAERIGPPSLL